MEIRDHKLSGVEVRRLPYGGVIAPRFIVVHYTAGGSADGSHRAMENARLSAHLLVDRDGTVIQCVDFNRRAYHAGASRWRGFRSLNGHSIGIEVCNYGWMFQRGDGKYQRPSRFGATPAFEPDQVFVATHRNGWPVNAGWEIYPEAQLRALTEVCEALLEHYPQITEIVGHDDIAPERKQDPGPAMPVGSLQVLTERPDHEDEDGIGEGRRFEVIARSGLNMRAGPGTEHPVVAVLPFGASVFVSDESETWFPVDRENDGAVDGFVHSAFVRLA